MYCHSCGKQIAKESKFCSSCGKETLIQPEENKIENASTAIDPAKIGKELGKNLAIGTAKLGIKVAASPVTVPLNVMRWSLGIKTFKCPKCNKKNIKTVKRKVNTPGTRLLLFPLSLIVPPPRPLHVCRDCGFSWED